MLKLSSPAFENGNEIPPRYTGEGENVNPPLRWSGVPEKTREFALVCVDIDAPTEEPFVHWLVYNISPNVSALPEGMEQADRIELPVRADQGRNTWNQVAYGGPMPPQGHGVHRYIFRLYALDTELGLPPSGTLHEFSKAIEGHVIDSAELMGTYERLATESRAHKTA